MKNLVIFFSFILLGFCSCNKNDDALAPPITAENTFSCNIDGELFVPENHGGFIPLKGYLVNVYDDNSWRITLSNGKLTLHLFLKKVNSEGNYEVFQSDGDQFFVQDLQTAVELYDKTLDKVYISYNNSEEIEVVSYIENQKIILNFNKITLKSSQDSSDIVVLTDGKLNINKETLNID